MLSNAIFTLNKEQISVNELEVAEKQLAEFSSQFPNLYGKENQVFNQHLLSHIIDSVRNCGPVWCYSNFPFEDMNGVLKNYVNGTSDVLKQIATKFLLNKKIKEKMGSDCERLKKNVKKVADMTLFGNGALPTKTLKKQISKISSISETDMIDLRLYKSCTINSNFIKRFDNQTERDDSLLKTKSGEYHRVYHIYKIRDEVFFLTRKNEISKADKTLYVGHLKQVLSESEMQSLPATEFLEKVISIKTKHLSLISTFPNNIERY